MSEEANPQTAAALLPPPPESLPARPGAAEPEVKGTSGVNGKVEVHEVVKEVAPKPEAAHESAPIESMNAFLHLNIFLIQRLIQFCSRSAREPETTNDKQIVSDELTQESPAIIQDDSEMVGEMKLDDSALAIDETMEPVDSTSASAGKSKSRRKSGGIPEHKNKKLNKKASKAKITHTDAQPGDYFYARLKGYPLWPAIVCDEAMLPSTLLNTRPVTAARPDGTYRPEYEDGGAKVKDRKFPVMFLYTNEL